MFSKETADLHSQGRICLVCKKQISRYACPRCNKPYCSLECYKSHSQSCTEQFYKENIDEVLKSSVVSQNEKKKMLEVLQRIRQQDIEEEPFEGEENAEEDEEYIRLMEKLELGEDVELEHLSPKLLEEFKRAISEGSLGNAIELWTPWWESKPPKVIDPENPPNSFPQPLPSIPPLSSLTKVPPSPLLRFHLIDILFAYAFTTRFFNGDCTSEPAEAIGYIIHLSSVLASKTVNFQSASQALANSIENSLKPEVFNSVAFSVAIIEDVSNIIAWKEWTVSALSDLHKLFAIAEESLKKEKQKTRKDFKMAEKKCWFFLVWSTEQDPSLFSNLEIGVRDEYERQKRLIQTRQQKKEEEETSAPPKVLIEEL